MIGTVLIWVGLKSSPDTEFELVMTSRDKALLADGQAKLLL